MPGQQTGNVDLRQAPHDPLDDEIDKSIDDAIAASIERKRRAAAPLSSKILDVGKQTLGGMAEGALSTRIGWNELTGDTNEANKLRSEDRREIQDWRGEPLSAVGTGAHVVGRLGYEVGEFAAPGGILGKASKIISGAGKLAKAAELASAAAKATKAAEVATTAGKAAEAAQLTAEAATATEAANAARAAGQARGATKVGELAARTTGIVEPGKTASFARKVGTNVALAAPLNVVKSADRDNSTAGALADATGNSTLKSIADSRLGRGALEVGVDALANTGAELVHGGLRARKLKKILAERAEAQTARALEQARATPAAPSSALEAAAAALPDQTGKDLTTSSEAGGALSTSPTEILEGTQAPPRSSSVESVVPSETSRVGSPSSTTTRSTESGEGASAIAEPHELGAVDPASGKKILQPSSDLKTLLAKAEEATPQLRSDLEEAAAGIPGVHIFGVRAKHIGPDGLVNPNGVKRLEQKIAERGGSAHVISDYVGGRVWLDDPRSADAVVSKLEGKGWKVLEDENFLDGKGKDRLGYKARHMQLVAPNGLSVEFQMQPRGVGEVQEAAHLMFNVLREPTAPTALRKELTERARNAFALGEHAPPHEPVTFNDMMQEVGPLPKHTGEHEVDAANGKAYLDKFEQWYRGKTGQGAEIPGPRGRDDVVQFSDGREIPSRYRVLEADALQASHDPHSFAQNPNYPAGVQGRIYHGDAGKAAREQTIANTNTLRPLGLLDATVKVSGPPTISPEGIVIAGNQRAMMLKRAATEAPDKAAAYRDMLQQRAHLFGIDPEKVAGMRNPVLVRELQHGAERDLRDPALLGELNRLSDIRGTKAKDVISEGASRAAALADAPTSLRHFASTFNPDEHTLRSYLDTAHGRDFVKALVGDGVIQPQESARYIDAASGQLTRQGKQSIEDMLYSSAIGSPDVVATAPDFALQKLEHAIPSMVKAARTPGWDLAAPMKDAFEILNAKSASKAKSVAALLDQGDLLGRKWSTNGEQLAQLLESGNKHAISETFRRYAEAAGEAAKADGGAGLFGDAETAAGAQARLLGGASSAPAAAGAGGGGGGLRMAANRTGRVGDMRGGELGVRMMSSLSGSGIGAAAGYSAGRSSDGTADQRRDRALAWALGGAALGAGLPWADRGLAAALHASKSAGDALLDHAVDKLGLDGLDQFEHVTQFNGAAPMHGAIGAQPELTLRKVMPVDGDAGRVQMKFVGDDKRAIVADVTDKGDGKLQLNFLGRPSSTLSDGSYTSRDEDLNTLGVRQVRSIIDGIRAHFPDAQILEGERINGARRDAGDRVARFDLSRRRTGAIGDQDLFGNVETGAVQTDLLGAPAARTLSAEERAAAARIPRLQQELELVDRQLGRAPNDLLTKRKGELTRELAQLQKLTNRGEKIGGAELGNDLFGRRSGAIGNQPGGSGAAPDPAPVTATPAAAPPPPIDPEDFARLSKFSLDPSGEQTLRGEITRVVAANGLNPKAVVTHEQTAAIAKSLGLDPAQFIKKEQLNGAELLAARNLVKANVDKLVSVERELLDAGIPDARREQLEQLRGVLEHHNDQLLGRFVVERSRAGRDLNSLKITAAQSLDPVLWLTRAKRELGENPLTDKIRSEILELINTGNRAGLAQRVAQLRTVSPWDKALTLWKAGLLTNPTTHFANLIGNTSMAALETAKDAPAAAFDAMLSVVSGNRTKAMPGLNAVSSSWDGARRGVREALEVVKNGQTAQQAAKLDMHREIDFKNPILDAYTKTIFRSLSAADQVFRGMALSRSIDNQARVVAKSEGLRGSAYRNRVSQLVAAPTDEMTVRGISDAELATFNNNGVLARVAAGARKPLGPIGDIVLPFARTPANVATRVAEYSPLGAASAAADILRAAVGRDMPPELQAKIVDRLGRSATGAGAIAVGYYLAAHGKLNAGRPTQGSGKADEFDLEGKSANAVLIGGKWHGLNRFSPVGNLLTLGAHIYNAQQEPNATPATIGMRAITGIGQNVTEQSFLRGTSDLIDAVKGAPGAPERYMENTAGSIVPAAVANVAHSMDPTVRETHGVVDQLQSRIPGLSSRLQPKVNQLGEDVAREGGAAETFLDPTNSRLDRRAHDPLVAEFSRVGAQLTKLKRAKDETPAAFTNRQRVFGQALENVLQQVIASDDYRQIPQIAAQMVDQQPELRGRDPVLLARALQRSQIEDATRTVRRYLTMQAKAPQGGDVAAIDPTE